MSDMHTELDRARRRHTLTEAARIVGHLEPVTAESFDLEGDA